MPRPKVDMSGLQLGDLTVIAYAGMKYHGAAWLCRCKCGREVVRTRRSLKKNQRHNCKRCPRAVPSDQIERMRALAKKGYNAHAIALKLGIPVSRARRWAKAEAYSKHGLKARLKEVNALRQSGMTFRAIVAETGWGGAPRAYRIARAKALQARLHHFEHRQSRVMEAKRLTQQGLSALDIAGQLGVDPRSIARYRSVVVDWPLPELDLERIDRLRRRGVSYGEINRRIGRPLECGEELEVAVNWLLDMRGAELLAA